MTISVDFEEESMLDAVIEQAELQQRGLSLRILCSQEAKQSVGAGVANAGGEKPSDSGGQLDRSLRIIRKQAEQLRSAGATVKHTFIDFSETYEDTAAARGRARSTPPNLSIPCREMSAEDGVEVLTGNRVNQAVGGDSGRFAAEATMQQVLDTVNSKLGFLRVLSHENCWPAEAGGGTQHVNKGRRHNTAHISAANALSTLRLIIQGLPCAKKACTRTKWKQPLLTAIALALQKEGMRTAITASDLLVFLPWTPLNYATWICVDIMGASGVERLKLASP